MNAATGSPIVLGIDVGTTSIKGVALDLEGATVSTASTITQWDVAESGDVQMPIDRLADAALHVMQELARTAPTGSSVVGIGIAGLAETGVIVDAHGSPCTPAIAWYDQRGAEELASLPADFLAEFSAVMGLAAKAECSFAKLLWLQSKGMRGPAGAVWLNALEDIAFRLTGVAALSGG